MFKFKIPYPNGIHDRIDPVITTYCAYKLLYWDLVMQTIIKWVNISNGKGCQVKLYFSPSFPLLLLDTKFTWTIK